MANFYFKEEMVHKLANAKIKMLFLNGQNKDEFPK